jgi:hypothetical protein
MVSSGLGSVRVAAAAIRGVVVCMVAIANWAAFFSAHVHCVESISLFGVPLLSRLPAESDCRARLRGIVLGIDAVIALLIAGSVWWNRKSRKSPGTGPFS